MDRLTTLVDRFRLTVHAADAGHANLVALADGQGAPAQVLFYPRGGAVRSDAEILFAVRVDWQAAENPLMAALPDVLDYDLTHHNDVQGLVSLIQQEVTGHRCGAQSVVNRLGEALLVRVLRDQIERGTTETGLLAGMADPRLHRAIVSMHDHPGRVWCNADLAQIAGLSLSRFVELFGATVGETPMGYLRRWRLVLARQDALRGDRIDAIARRYAYKSTESFTRAFRQAYGLTPSALRK